MWVTLTALGSIAGAESVLRQAGYSMLLMNSENDPELEGLLLTADDFDVAVEDLLAFQLEIKFDGSMGCRMGWAHLQFHYFCRQIFVVVRFRH